jgi:hypothetical protein
MANPSSGLRSSSALASRGRCEPAGAFASLLKLTLSVSRPLLPARPLVWGARRGLSSVTARGHERFIVVGEDSRLIN